MNCPHCFQPISGTDAFCQHCGARLAEPGVLTASEATEDPTYGALAHANLLRLRGDWEGAREKTVAVMREYPNSGTAHSLMGDIFADQQLYDEASQWYRMALDLEPNNVADSRKLAGASKHLQEAVEAADNAPDTPPRFSVVRVAAVASMVFLVFAISLGFYVKTHTVPLTDLGPTWKRPAPSVAGPSAGPPGETQPPASPGATTPPALSPAIGEGLVHSDRENTLVYAIRKDLLQSQAPVSLVGATIDPRFDNCTLTLDASRLAVSARNWMAQLHAFALSVAASALKADTAIKTVTVRVLMPLPGFNGNTDDVAFIGDLDAPAPTNLSVPPAPTAFTRRWWNRGLTPPAGMADTAL
ncbi:MAG TPA: hypothetical protein VGM51_15870 [Armatimonadota bacterium]|jgi:tetratricopeptide (TPR) repeat protein